MVKAKKDIGEAHRTPFAVVLRTLMEKTKKTSQWQLAEVTGKTRQTISQYVNGISEPSYDTLVKIADYFNVSVDYLLGRTKDPKMERSAMDELGISESVIEWFRRNMTETSNPQEFVDGINAVLSNPALQDIVYGLREYGESVKAREIYSVICHESNSKEERKAKIMEVVHAQLYSDSINRCLIGNDFATDIDVCQLPSAANFLQEVIVSDFSELYASRLSRKFALLLNDIECSAVNDYLRNRLEDN